jgi:N-acetylneuraminic acid mutarotase
MMTNIRIKIIFIAIVVFASVCHAAPNRLFWQAVKAKFTGAPANQQYEIFIRFSVSDMKACYLKGPDMPDYVPAVWNELRDQWGLEVYDLTLEQLRQQWLGTWYLKLIHDDDQESIYTITISGDLEDSDFLPIPELIEPAPDSNIIAEDYIMTWDPNDAQSDADALTVEIGGSDFIYLSSAIDTNAVTWNPGWLELGAAYCKIGYFYYRPDMIEYPLLVSGPSIAWGYYNAFLVSGDKHFFTVKYSLDFYKDYVIDFLDLEFLCSHWLETRDTNNGRWMWVSGSNGISQYGVYGTKGVANINNVPGAREDSVTWIDGNGNLWLFGGDGYGTSGNVGWLNDLWKFDGTNWTWVSGSSVVYQYGVYGTKGVPASGNVPGGRSGSVSWLDGYGNQWFFGGAGFAENGSWGYLNDMWTFDGINWTWVSGSNTINQNGTYGTSGVPASNNMPGGRYSSISYIDDYGNLWLFGGYGYAASSSIGLLNDLWKFDGTNWTWVIGPNTINQKGVYGTKEVAASGNMPGARERSISWIDGYGNLWLFGGWGYDANGSLNSLNDLWKFDGFYWTWVGGSDTGNHWGVYGTKGVAASGNVPGARKSSISRVDDNGNLWLFGGDGYDANSNIGRLNDLWKFDGTYWTWVSGSNSVNQRGVYGTKGVAASGNVPGARDFSFSWIDGQGNLWLFGGYGWDANSNIGYLNDLWKFGNKNLVGDLNGDDIVNFFDYAIFARHWLEVGF